MSIKPTRFDLWQDDEVDLEVRLRQSGAAYTPVGTVTAVHDPDGTPASLTVDVTGSTVTVTIPDTVTADVGREFVAIQETSGSATRTLGILDLRITDRTPA